MYVFSAYSAFFCPGICELPFLHRILAREGERQWSWLMTLAPCFSTVFYLSRHQVLQPCDNLVFTRKSKWVLFSVKSVMSIAVTVAVVQHVKKLIWSWNDLWMQLLLHTPAYRDWFWPVKSFVLPGGQCFCFSKYGLRFSTLLYPVLGHYNTIK